MACSLCLSLGFSIDRNGALDHSCFNLPVFTPGIPDVAGEST